MEDDLRFGKNVGINFKEAKKEIMFELIRIYKRDGLNIGKGHLGSTSKR